jgi:glucose/arabinose dehydrogenase
MRARYLFILALAAGAALSAGCPLPNGYRTVAVFPQANFPQMTGMHWLPDDPTSAVVLTKGGIAYRVSTTDPSREASIYLDLRERMISRPAGEEGFLGFAFAPDFASTRRFYVYYTAEGGGPVRGDGLSRQSRISRFTASGGSADPASEVVLLEQPQPFTNHNGGALAFGPDGFLYLSLGDGGSGGDPQGNAQRLDTLLGKVLRIDVSGDKYVVPASNPFVGLVGARSEIYAYGFRNPWRISFDDATGQLWAGDVGQDRVEEVNLVQPGGNYGWNRLEGTACYNTTICDQSGTILPVAEYTHEFGCSVSGGHVYRGEAMPELQGWYVYGDFCSGRIWAVNVEGERKTPIPIADSGRTIAAFAQDPAGELYIVTFEKSIERIVRK